MSQRYGLTPPQQEAVRPLLESERKQMESLRKDDSLEPGEMFTRSMAIHQVANTKIEDVLTPPQKSKFEQDEAKMEDSRRNRKERMAGPEDMPPPPGSGPPLN